LYKLCKYASELEWSGGRRGRVEAEEAEWRQKRWMGLEAARGGQRRGREVVP